MKYLATYVDIDDLDTVQLYKTKPKGIAIYLIGHLLNVLDVQDKMHTIFNREGLYQMVSIDVYKGMSFLKEKDYKSLTLKQSTVPYVVPNSKLDWFKFNYRRVTDVVFYYKDP